MLLYILRAWEAARWTSAGAPSSGGQPLWGWVPFVWLLDGLPHSINFARNARDWFWTAARFADRLAR